MPHVLNPQEPFAQRFLRVRPYVLVALAATLSSTVTLKFGEIQYLEWIFAADLFLLTVMMVVNGARFQVYRPFLSIARLYIVFLVAAFVLCLVALQQDFTVMGGSFFKRPVVVTLARMGELFLDVFYMLYLATLFRQDESLCRFGARAYCWAGAAGCLYSFLTYPLNVFYEMQLGTYLDIHRFRGFNNEGGGFGLYMLSVCLLMVVMNRHNWLTQRQYRYGLGVFLVGLIGAQSKSAFVALAFIGLVVVLAIEKGWRRWAIVSAMALVLVMVGSYFNFDSLTRTYIRSAQLYQETSLLRGGDGNFVMGRVAGLVLAPRMLAARPLTGVGWGNYPLVRDDREYRQGTAFSITNVDAPSLGIVDYVVELGVPLCLFLIWLEMKPAWMLLRKRADWWVISLALVLPVSTLCGAHLNLMHQWIIVAFALGIGFNSWDQHRSLVQDGVQ